MNQNFDFRVSIGFGDLINLVIHHRASCLPVVMDGIPAEMISPVPFSGLPEEVDEKPVSMSGVVYLTRGVSSGFAKALVMGGESPVLDFEKAKGEHDAFVKTLKQRGGPLVSVVEIEADKDQPDCVFVEDCLVALPGRGVLQCAPCDSRLGEVEPVSKAAQNIEFQFPPGKVEIDYITDPSDGSRIEGGDVLYVKGGDDVYHHYFVGVGNRSNALGAESLRKALRNSLKRCTSKKLPNDADESQLFKVHEIDLSVDSSWLHLKSAVTWAPYVGFVASSDTCPIFQEMKKVCEAFEQTTTNLIHDEKPVVVPRHSTNVLPLPGGIVFVHPDAVTSIKEKGGSQVEVISVDQPELAKADGALTCGVLVLDPFFEWTGFS